ncbi:MAG: hypothetical protein NWF01_11860 [Candidatus Bathyarchaeota archaeon]|nr:hypothetical protein [Candidatus Bathyarchaeota archaeon]
MHKQHKKSFNEILLSSIDEALAALGEDIKTSIYFHLEDTYHIKKEQIPDNLEQLSDALEKIFGIGARYLEILFMKQLYFKLEENFNLPKTELFDSELKFVEYVHLLKAKYEQVLVA